MIVKNHNIYIKFIKYFFYISYILHVQSYKVFIFVLKSLVFSLSYKSIKLFWIRFRLFLFFFILSISNLSLECLIFDNYLRLSKYFFVSLNSFILRNESIDFSFLPDSYIFLFIFVSFSIIFILFILILFSLKKWDLSLLDQSSVIVIVPFKSLWASFVKNKGYMKDISNKFFMSSLFFRCKPKFCKCTTSSSNFSDDLLKVFFLLFLYFSFGK